MARILWYSFEMFRDIPFAEGYEINEAGQVRRVGKSQPLKPFKRGKYLAVRLHGKNYSIHRLVLLVYNPVPGADYLDVDHIDYDVTNNHLNNLRWLDHFENARRQRRRKGE